MSNAPDRVSICRRENRPRREWRAATPTPSHPAIAADPALFAIAATGGDDYELLAAVPPAAATAFEAAAKAAGVDVSDVGEALEGAAPPQFLGPDGRVMSFMRGSFSHF